MIFRGKVYKDKNYYLIEIPDLGLMSQSKTLKEAKKIIPSLILDLVDKNRLEISISFLNRSSFLIQSSEPKYLIGLMLSHLRKSKGLTVREVCQNLNFKSTRAYTAYEYGEKMPSPKKLEELIQGIDHAYVPVTELVKFA